MWGSGAGVRPRGVGGGVAGGGGVVVAVAVVVEAGFVVGVLAGESQGAVGAVFGWCVAGLVWGAPEGGWGIGPRYSAAVGGGQFGGGAGEVGDDGVEVLVGGVGDGLGDGLPGVG